MNRDARNIVESIRKNVGFLEKAVQKDDVDYVRQLTELIGQQCVHLTEALRVQEEKGMKEFKKS